MKAKNIALAIFTILLLASTMVRPGYAQIDTPTPETPTSTPPPPPVYSISVVPDSNSKSGQPGTLVSYSVNVKNTGNMALSLSVESVNSAGWVVTLNSTLNLPVGGQADLAVAVTIAPSAQSGYMGQTILSFKQDGATLGSATLNTTAQAPASPGRPMIVLESYSAGSSGSIAAGQQFDLRLRVANVGKGFARNIIFTFTGADFLPLDTGGVRTIFEMDPDEKLDVVQPMLASGSLLGQKYATTAVAVNYTDLNGQAYTENFTLTINLSQPSSSGVARATATPTQISRPQLVVSGYTTDVDPLQPGTIFSLDLEIRNLGSSDARAVTMVLGGGASTNDGSGTPSASGVSGSSADTTVFAPLGSSNLVYLGDVPIGVTIQSSQKLIVNTSANPGAYPFKISFVYDDAKGVRQVNDQVITLLILQLPQLEINYYRDPGVFMLGQPNVLPLQVTNLGRKTTVLGNMKVTAQNADVTNNVTLVGVLDPGGYFTLDSNVIPMAPGQLELNVVLNYTDDFNQPRVINTTLTIEVMDVPTPEPFPTNGYPKDGGVMPPVEETAWQKILRFVKGLLGLGSGTTTPVQQAPDGSIVPEKVPPQNMQPAPVIVVPPKG